VVHGVGVDVDVVQGLVMGRGLGGWGGGFFRFKGAMPGPSPVNDSASAVDLFCRFFTDEVWDLLVAETNRYAAMCRQQNTHPCERPWTMSLLSK